MLAFSVTDTPTRTGMLCVVSGPSGSGKTTLCRRARDEEGCVFSTSCTTRAPREGERDGEHYHFLGRSDFLDRTVQGEFLEWAQVHGQFYGTLRSEVIDHLEAGRDVLLDIDVQGAQLVRSCEDAFIREAVVDIFILPPDMDTLRGRLAGRGTESEEQLNLRLYNALDEMRHWREYRYAILSGTHEEDYARFRAILHAERLRSTRLLTPPSLTRDGDKAASLPRPRRDDQSELPFG